ncbi:hypothetical protein EVAR_86935_1 [Eumeta japonica]|uniref:Uncharacterized protein n=1 Tax=Eumeta variegata TaxID=151549 RepID=A0A4C1W6N9_EUMVA|nr:hypothetical protein EVAR_86935_1 [Eumeta japonica]
MSDVIELIRILEGADHDELAYESDDENNELFQQQEAESEELHWTENPFGEVLTDVFEIEQDTEDFTSEHLKNKNVEDKAIQTTLDVIYYKKTSNVDFEASVENLPCPKFFDYRPKNIQNEYFASLIAFELDSVKEDDRSLVYMEIINVIRKFRGQSLLGDSENSD